MEYQNSTIEPTVLEKQGFEPWIFHMPTEL